MHNHKEIKIREGLLHLLREEEENLPLIEKKLRESEKLIENEIKKIELERKSFIKEMEDEKERLIKEGIDKIEKECEKIYGEGKGKAEELVNNLEKYKEIALKVFEEIILKEGGN